MEKLLAKVISLQIDMINNNNLSKKDHWGDPLSENIEFFILPNNIGEIITAYSTLTTDKKEPTKFWGNLFIGLFEHHCSFIGTHGFAFYKILKTRKNIVKAFELNFDNVTDLLSGAQQRNINFNYQNTAYGFEWSNNGKIIADFSDVMYDKEDTIDKSVSVEFWINKFAEQQWTKHLLNRLNTDLKLQGYIEFRILKNDELIPFLHLSPDYIKSIESGKETTITKDKIKHIVIKKNKLLIEDIYFEQKLIRSNNGNRIDFSLNALSNRLFFIKVLETFFGSKLI